MLLPSLVSQKYHLASSSCSPDFLEVSDDTLYLHPLSSTIQSIKDGSSLVVSLLLNDLVQHNVELLRNLVPVKVN